MLSKFLQKPYANKVQALDLCDVTIMNLEKMKDDCFDEIISECKIICKIKKNNDPKSVKILIMMI